MFNDAQNDTQPDRIGLIIGEIEEWLAEHEYDIAEVRRTGEFDWDEPGFAVGAENDAVLVGFLPDENAEPVVRTYSLDELWMMSRDEWAEELEEMLQA